MLSVANSRMSGDREIFHKFAPGYYYFHCSRYFGATTYYCGSIERVGEVVTVMMAIISIVIVIFLENSSVPAVVLIGKCFQSHCPALVIAVVV